jgi:hypothetical protein
MSGCNQIDCSGCSKKRGRDPTNEEVDNKVTKNNEDSVETFQDDHVNQVLQDLSSQVTYVTGPQDSRKYVQIHLASENKKTDEELITILSNNLQQSDPNIIFYIAGFKSVRFNNSHDKDNKIIYGCDVCIFTIAKALIAQLIARNIKQIYYFIGNWSQDDKFLISSNKPDSDEIAKINREGMEMPFETCLLNLETM